ncbi:alternate-type signal peptide domain-containing protein [Cellulosimicrobium marinum]|uniref:alternate-type signal peptide domain-containing protein n=1 Tax=Cellulosimicrobium marinum TaxID=1638992 RepID=UPI001E44C09B|nr:alternate-type signal peptide domain-containing protein [Cellulosimicrobium marinum]MCB7137270.1 alternate-type signal peptide domain-containing protein [Cellulosimicrobium marinum]
MSTAPTTPPTSPTTRKGAAKGAVAAAAGVTVLLGGMGTFALWNQDVDLAAGEVSTGNLSATAEDFTWQDTTPGHANAVADVSSFTMVPGDVLVGTSTIDVEVTGENLVVEPTLSGGEDLVGTVDGLTVDTELTEDAAAVGQLTAGTHELTATVTVTYAESGSNDGMNATVDLTDVGVALQQVAPSAS